MSVFPSSWDEPYPGRGQPRSGFKRVTEDVGHQGHPGAEAAPGAAPSRPADVAAVLAAAGSPRQRELAGEIYARLKAGGDVDDVTDLIGELSRVASAPSQRTFPGGKSHGGGA